MSDSDYTDSASDYEEELINEDDEEYNGYGGDGIYEDYEEYDEDEEEEEEMFEDLESDLAASLSRCSSAPVPVEEEATANTIIESLQNILPELESAPSNAPVRMTDLGLKISQMVLHRRPVESPEMELEEAPDAFLEKTLTGRRRNRTGKRGRPKKVDYGFGKSTTQNLPPETSKLMGQANMCYVSRRYEEAIVLLLEVIRQAPHAFEAYQTLALIHEERGDRDKAYSYYVIAAHLIKNDPEVWRKLALLTLELNRPVEAIYYLGRLIRMRDARPEYFWTRARLWVEREEYRKATLGFLRLLLLEVEGDGEAFLQVATFATRVEHADLVGGIFLQTITLAINTRRIPSMAVIMYVLGWLQEQKELDKIQNVVESVAVPLISDMNINMPVNWYALDDEQRMLMALDNLTVEIRLYYIISRVGLKKPNDHAWVGSLDPHRYGALMRILGKTLLANAQPTSALAILLPLMDVPTLGDPDLGVSIGECYRLIPGQEEMSIGTFEAVLAVCPERGDVRTALCDLYRQQGLLEKAAAVLKQENVQWPTPTVQPERHPPYPADEVFQGLFAWDSTLPLPEIETGGSRSLLHLRGDTAIRRRKSKRRVRRVRRFIAYSEAQMNAVQQDYHRIMRLCVGSNEAANLRQARQLAAPLIEDMMSNPSLRPADKQAVRTTDLSLLHGLTISEWFDLLCRYLVVECHVGSVERALKFTRIFLSRSVFHLDSYTSVVLRLLHLGIAQQTGSNSAVLQATRWFIRVWSDLPLSSNLLTKAMANCPPDTIDAPFLRFLERLAARHPERPLVQASNLALMLYTERYESAIRTGYVLLAKCANHPMGLLATAVALLHQSAKRTCRAPGLLQRRAFALIHHYRNIVGISGDYNVARAYHMMGKPELAVTYYRRALKSPLRTAAAFNLHLLFIQAGEHALAAHYLAKYLAVV